MLASYSVMFGLLVFTIIYMTSLSIAGKKAIVTSQRTLYTHKHSVIEHITHVIEVAACSNHVFLGRSRARYSVVSVRF